MSSDRAAFEQFVAAGDALDTLAAFEQLAGSAAAPLPDGPEAFYTALRARIVPALPFKLKSLFTTLDKVWAANARHRERLAVAAADLGPRARPLEIVVSGGGPCGLRAAIEAATLGHSVRLVELRAEFSRPNVLKSWQPTVDDLVRLGATAFLPNFKAHGNLHIATQQMQLTLFKTALLYGVRVHISRGVCGILDPAFDLAQIRPDVADAGSRKWRVWTATQAAARVYLRRPDPATLVAELSFQPVADKDQPLQKTSLVDFVEPPISADGAILRSLDAATDDERALLSDPSTEFLSFDVLLAAEGEASRLIRRLGFERKITRFAEAIGIVANFDFTPGAKGSSPERQIEERIYWRAAADWRSSPIGTVADQGLEVENIEYMRSSTAHFIAVSTRIRDLVSAGIVAERRETVRDTLQADNMNFDRLRDMGRALARSVGVPDSAPFATRHGIQAFDFSSRGLCVEHVRWLTSASAERDAVLDMPALVLPIGDALQNPFWPQGLGVNRGTHNALDAVWMAHILAASGGNKELAIRERSDAFKTMEWSFRPDRLRSGTEWSADPIDRYSPETYKSRHFKDVKERLPQPTVLERIRTALGLIWDPNAQPSAAASAAS
nr:[F-actin]-monooxygenase mical3 [Polyrhizophydium stewartii]